jgi:hypothetical protein
LEFPLGLSVIDDPEPDDKAAVEVEGTKLFVDELMPVFVVWPRRFDAALEPEVVLDTPEVADTEDDELCRVIVCWGGV